ncbi:MAG: thioredoxin fold domain-containing protein [Gammaproteobacteria bacterium]|nr:thioredoxin fold domain-containing protein [Gammaproteobacteria bacterium]
MSRITALLAFIGLVFAGPLAGDSVYMVQVEDLRQEAERLRRDKLVLVLEFSSEYCSFCRKMEELFLLPMQRNEDYSKTILIRSVSLDAYETLVDFDGRLVSTRDFASRYDVSFTPTLLFLDADGVELSERLVGIWSEDFYGVYIDERIDAARAGL